MTYDDFSERLRKIKGMYKETTGKDMVSILELESYLDKMLARPKKRGAKSLRGLSL